MNETAPFPAASQYLLANFDCLEPFAGPVDDFISRRQEGIEFLTSVVAHCFSIPDSDPTAIACAEAIWQKLAELAGNRSETDADDATRMRIVGDTLDSWFPNGEIVFPLE